MVQYKNADRYKGSDYWKLTWHIKERRKYVHERLDELKFQYNASTGGARMAEVISRAERGLMSYEKCSLDELRIFCTARQIPGIDHTSRKKRDYIALLEHADDDGATFQRFSDLPAELRVRVYSHYMDMLDGWKWYLIRRHREENEIKSSRTLPPPPIAQVCTWVRRETLPMFFDIFRLDIQGTGRSGHPHDHISPIVESMPLHLVSHVKKITFHDHIILKNRSGRAYPYSLAVDFATPHRPLRITLETDLRAKILYGKDTVDKVSDLIKRELLRFADS